MTEGDEVPPLLYDAGANAASETPALADSDREPIRLPERIQGHGALLAFRPEDQIIVRASTNVPAFLADSSGAGHASTARVGRGVLGRRLDELFDATVVEQLVGAAREGPVRFANPLTLRLADDVGHPLACIAHRCEELVVLEFEPIEHEDSGGLTSRSVDPYFDLVHRLLQRLEDCGTVAQLAEVVAGHAREFTGFDRVMVYRFHPDGHGEVISEAAREGLDSFLGLQFPASDVSEQARELYRHNFVRLIVDVEAPSVAIEADPDAPDADEPLDLSSSVLRSVSEVHEIHGQRLRSIGVRASMSVSLMHGSELWGMLLFHHDQPRFVPFSVRGACELLGAVITPRFAWQQLEFERLRARESQAAVEQAMHLLVEQDFSEEAIDRALLTLSLLFEASGACLRRDSEDHVYGSVPCTDVRDRLFEAVYDQGDELLFTTDSLEEFAENERERRSLGDAVGALAVLAYDDVGILLVREPQRELIRWAGRPTDGVEQPPTADQLQQRASLGECFEEQSLRVPPWRERERQLARAIRSMLMTAMVSQLDAMEDRLEARMRELTGLALRRGRLRALLEIAELSHWEFDLPSGRIFDTHWLRMLGYEPGDVEPTIEGIRKVLHPEDADAALDAFQEFVEHGAERYDITARFLRKDGTPQVIHSRGRVTQRDAAGRPKRILGVLFPLNSDESSDRAVEQRYDELEALIHAISHDLKSPLVTCLGFVGLAVQSLEIGNTDAVRSDLGRIDTAARKMSRIIDDLLMMSRIGRVAFLKAPLDLADLFRETARGLMQRASERGVELVVGDHAPLIVGDRASLSRALENLLSNALKYGCPDGGRVEVGAERDGDEVRIFVRDEGPGIEPHLHERIFERFARLSNDDEGTGIGLASVARVAHVHGGRAWVTSTPGEGATFWISLPAPTDPTSGSSTETTTIERETDR